MYDLHFVGDLLYLPTHAVFCIQILYVPHMPCTTWIECKVIKDREVTK